MIDTTFAQVRFALSFGLGLRFSIRNLETLVRSLRETRHEYGAVGSESEAALGNTPLDADTLAAMQLQRFGKQAKRAAQDTSYYSELFSRLGIDPSHLTQTDIARIPLTSKEAVRTNPDAFVRRSAHPFLRATTTGTTGIPTAIHFSQHELQVYALLTAIGALTSGDIRPDDIVQISTTARGTLGNLSLAGGCAAIGAQVYLAGVIDPAQALSLLTEDRRMAGFQPKTSILYTYPSYLGMLVETGKALGYRPQDFGLRRIIVGGEIVTAGLKERARQIFGDVVFSSGYGMTEIWPFGGEECTDGHLHYSPQQGLAEILEIDSERPAAPGTLGRIVATPFAPYRETTLLLRYDTGDLVRVLSQVPTCALRALPATSLLQGKRAHAIHSSVGWIPPRIVAEAVEAVEAIPLPARYSFQPDADGIAVTVVVKTVSAAIEHQIATRLLDAGVPLTRLHVTQNPADLKGPIPLRGDMRDGTFPAEPVTRPVAEVYA